MVVEEHDLRVHKWLGSSLGCMSLTTARFLTFVYAYKNAAQTIRMTGWQHDVVDVAGPTKLNHHWSFFATPTDGVGGGYADATDTDTTETA